MGLWLSYKLRLRRRRYLLRAIRKRRELQVVRNRTRSIQPKDILVFATIQDEAALLPYFLDHYRRMGVQHFLIVDNNSQDETQKILINAPDVSCWYTSKSYRHARFGMDWINLLLLRHGKGHWCLTVDADEFLTYPHEDSRPLKALTDWMDLSGIQSMPAMLLDLYADQPFNQMDAPLDSSLMFDVGNYRTSRNPEYQNLWIQGGARERLFFSDNPTCAPALNKIPLVKWHWRYAYASSTHTLLPRRLNVVYGKRTKSAHPSGLLLHTKLAHNFWCKTLKEIERKEHFDDAKEYQAYARGLARGTQFSASVSHKICDWRELEGLKLMSRGDWA